MFTDGTALSFWENWNLLGGLVLCFLCATFPRIAMIVACLAGGLGVSLAGVMGWIFIPRISIAIIATVNYFDTNPILCIVAWIILLGGEGAEKRALAKAGSK